jgi:hypothetical protein
MIKLFDRVKVNTPTTGTGDITFGAVASTAFLTPIEAGVLDGDEVRYVIVDGLDFEEGVGLIKDTVATMERTVTKSKVGGVVGTSALNLSGTAVLALTASAADILTQDDNLESLKNPDVALDNLGGTATGKAIFKATAKADAITATTGDYLRVIADYAVTAADNGKVIVTEKSGNCTISLPPAGDVVGMRIIVKNFSTTTTIDPDGSEQIDAGATKVLTLGRQSVAIVSTGTGWLSLLDGDVFESGPGFIRYAGGVQHCWGRGGSDVTTNEAQDSFYISSFVDLTFARPFASPPVAVPACDKASGGAGIVWASLGTGYPTTTQVRIFLIAGATARAGRPAYKASGPWF